MSQVVKRQVCKCDNCGNEAEMVVTCSLPEDTPPAATADKPKPASPPAGQKVKGQATCSHCGNEADMWIDI
jgi:hypothetical protein